MFIYTENYSESHRNTKHINIKPEAHKKKQLQYVIFFCIFKAYENTYVSKKKASKQNAFYADVHNSTNIAKGHTF